MEASQGHIVEDVKIKTLDSIAKSLHLKRIDYLKIDVEGFEGHVLKGGKQTISLHRPVAVMEMNHWCLNAFQRTSIPDFLDFVLSVFPIAYAVEGKYYLDLNNESERYIVMYNHINHMKYPNIIVGFDDNRFRKFKSIYIHGVE